MQTPQDYLIQRAMEISAKLASLEPMPDLDQDDVSPDDDATSTTDDDTTSEASTTAKRHPKSQQRRRGSKKTHNDDKTKQTSAEATTTAPRRMKKSVCFARNIKDGKIKCTTHYYPRGEQGGQGSVSVNELWYSQSELQVIHAASQVNVAFHQENSPDYITTIVGLAFSFEKNICTKEKKMQFKKEITKHSGDNDKTNARGLEPSIVKITQSWRAAHVDTVLNTQEELEKKGLRGRNKGLETLRCKSRETSRPSRQLAFLLAEHDTFEAMKATLLPWKCMITPQAQLDV